MLRFLIRYAPPVMLAVAPLFTYQFSLLDMFGVAHSPDGRVHLSVGTWAWEGAKPEIEMKLRAAVTLAGVGLLLISGYFDAYLPSRTLVSFRHDFLEQICKAEWRKRGRLRSDIRINVMYLRWRWYMPFGRSFEMVWKDEFDASDRDARLRLFIWQGVCGMAARRRQAAFVDFSETPLEVEGFAAKWLLQNRFRLWKWQIRKTRNLAAVLSIPIFEKRGPKGQEIEKCVGVINLDAKTDAGAKHLAEKDKDLALLFAKHGTLIAKMR